MGETVMKKAVFVALQSKGKSTIRAVPFFPVFLRISYFLFTFAHRKNAKK